MKYEILHNVDIEQNIENMEENGQKMNVREQLLKVTLDGKKLFVGVEQGSGRNEENFFVLFYLSMRKAATHWINSKHGKVHRIHQNEEHKTSVPVINEIEREHAKQTLTVSCVTFTPNQIKVNGHKDRMSKSWCETVTTLKNIPGLNPVQKQRTT